MIKRKLSKKIIAEKDFQLWNSFIDLLAMESEDDLTEIQKHAQRAFWYESEIQNGGHLQYFENFRMKDYSDIINSLKFIGANNHSIVLTKASNLFISKNRNPIKSIIGFVMKAKEGEYDNFDFEYNEISPDMNHYLSEYLKKYQDDFIKIE
mgnify:CR=1 FL=1